MTAKKADSATKTDTNSVTAHHKLLVIGAGTAGLTMASMMANKIKGLDVAILDPAETHYYQPAWTLVGAGDYKLEDTARPMSSVIPKHIKWIKESASEFDPDHNTVRTSEGHTYTYDYLIVAPGIQINWGLIPGLKESIGTKGICSNYSAKHVNYTFDVIKNLKKGTAIFTNPNTPIKCGGAPQKIMYLASDYWRKHGNLKDVDVKFNSAGGVIFGVPKFAETLNKVIARYGIETNFFHNLVEIRPDKQEAVFDILKDGKAVDQKVFSYDMLHVTPPMSAPDFIKKSALADANGWVDVDKNTLQHVRYPNIFGIGDATNTPNAKTGAAIRKQSKTVGVNLYQYMQTGSIKNPDLYTGYSSCPLLTGYGKTVLAEFDYQNVPMPSFPFNTAKERFSMYLLKKYALPFMYWKAMLKGHVG
jgi:sulfide:quinone oxidoreductase